MDADLKWQSNEWAKRAISAALEVHQILGPGLLESAYEECLCRELSLRTIPFERQVPVPLEYKGLQLDCAYRLDIVVGGFVILELKAVDDLLPVHEAQLLTYLRLTQLWLGLLINFNAPLLKHGIKRLVNG
jgi:GxxExxY protein